jgi:putative transposase
LSENTFGQGGYYVSTAGKDEEAVRAYIKKQEEEDERPEQLSILKED